MKVVNIELKKSKEGTPFVSVWKQSDNGTITFEHFPLVTGYGVYLCNEFFRSLHTELNIEFINFKQYNELIQELMNKCPLEI